MYWWLVQNFTIGDKNDSFTRSRLNQLVVIKIRVHPHLTLKAFGSVFLRAELSDLETCHCIHANLSNLDL